MQTAESRMSLRALVLASLVSLALFACTTTRPAAIEPTNSELQRLETAKWDPDSRNARESYLAMFADDFVSVEYGSDVQGGVHRKTRGEVFSGPPVPPARFELSDWQFVRADDQVIIVSYRVKGLSYPWNAYATSVWSRREGRWLTVFYQVSMTE